MIVPSVDQSNDVKKLIECNRNYHCPKTLPKCHKMSSPTSSGKKGYCVFRTCQYCQKKRKCPTIGPPLCPHSSPNGPGGLTGDCNAHLNTCEYSPFLIEAGCLPNPGKVKTAVHWFDTYRYVHPETLTETIE